MKQVLGLIYFPPSYSRSVARVRDFRRCPAHDNLLAFEGRALSVEEFNKHAPKLLGDGAKALYGVQPIAKLVEVEVAEQSTEAPLIGNRLLPAGDAGNPISPPASTVEEASKITVEPSGDGFVLVNYEGDEARYMGVSQAWETDVSLVRPFATEDDARAAAPGGVAAQPPAETASSPAEDSLTADSGASQPLVEDEAPAPGEPEASTPSPAQSVQPVVDPKNLRDAVMTAQARKRAAKAARNAPSKVSPPAAK